MKHKPVKKIFGKRPDEQTGHKLQDQARGGEHAGDGGDPETIDNDRQVDDDGDAPVNMRKKFKEAAPEEPRRFVFV
jgi:hypothetical protein